MKKFLFTLITVVGLSASVSAQASYTVYWPPGSLNFPKRFGPAALSMPRIGTTFGVSWLRNPCSMMLLLVGARPVAARYKITIPKIDGWLLTTAEFREPIAYSQDRRLWVIPNDPNLIGGHFYVQYVFDNCYGLQNFSSVGIGVIGR